jgi:hypothetical protein
MIKLQFRWRCASQGRHFRSLIMASDRPGEACGRPAAPSRRFGHPCARASPTTAPPRASPQGAVPRLGGVCGGSDARAAALSHRTAAELRGLPLPGTKEELVHAYVPGPQEPRIDGVHVHTCVHPVASERVGGLPLSTPARTWRDLAAGLDREDLAILGDAVLRGERVTPADLAAVFDAAGGWIACPDLQYPRQRVAIEYEGEHYLTRRQQRRDIRRDEQYREEGWTVIKVTYEDLTLRPGALVERIRRALGRA